MTKRYFAFTDVSKEAADLETRFASRAICANDAPYSLAVNADPVTSFNALQAALNAAALAGAAVVVKPTTGANTYNIQGNLSGSAKMALFCPGRAVFKGVNAVGVIWNFTVQGALTGLSTFIAATINRSDKSIQVVSTAGLVAGDSIELTGSPNEAENAANGPQRELNEVQSVTDATHLVLKYPAGHTYTFDNVNFATQGSCAKVTPLDDVSISGIDFDAIGLTHGYNRRFNIERVKFLNQGNMSSLGTSSLFVEAEIEVTSGIASAGANANAHVVGWRFFNLRFKSFGGHFDGLRAWGCSDGDILRPSIIEATGRGVYRYKCQNVDVWHPTVQGTQVSGVTNEAVLINFSYDCQTYHPVLDERFKLSSIVEFRGDSRDCYIIHATAHCAYTYPVTWKGSASNCKIIGGTWYSYYNGSAAYLVDLQIQALMPYPSLLIDGPKLVSKAPNTGFGGIRSVSTTESNVAAVSEIILRGVEYDRGGSNLIGLTGTGAGQKITRLVVENCKSTSDDPANGALIVNQLPAAQIEYRGLHLTPGTTRIIQQSSGLVDNMYVYNCACLTLNVADRVTALYYGDNAISTYTITDLTCVKAGIIEGLATLDFPSIAAAGTATPFAELTISVTGVQTTDKVRVVPPSGFTAGLIYDAWVSGTGVIRIRVTNSTNAAIDPPSGTYQWQIERRG